VSDRPYCSIDHIRTGDWIPPQRLLATPYVLACDFVVLGIAIALPTRDGFTRLPRLRGIPAGARWMMPLVARTIAAF
jgi:hypothetical protein